jgi:peptidoglycan hydrolase CwlO-like protein
MSGTATADKINRGLRTAKGTMLWRGACSTFLGSFMVAALFIVLAPMPGHADDDKDRHRGPEDNDKGIHAEIAALQATVSTLQHQVNTLQTVNADLQNELTTLQN